MLIHGINPVREAIRSRAYRPKRVYLDAARKGAKGQLDWIVKALASGGPPVVPEWVDTRELDRKAAQGNHQGVVAEVREFVYCDVAIPPGERPAVAVLLDGITDPQNLGAICRSAVAFGADLIVLPEDRSARVTPAVARVSSGAVFHARIAVAKSLNRAAEELEGAGLRLVGLDATASQTIREADDGGPVAVLLGSEDKGLRRSLRDRCALVRLPTAPGFPQLNAATALAVALYEVRARRG